MYIEDYNKKYGTYYANWQDVKNAQMYIVNGIVCDFFDAGKRPTKQQIMGAWESMHGSEVRMFTLVDIDWIIAKVAKFYN